ncbi:hypothetical protein VW35_12950 [Devosia soli]|uniref:Fe/B12 periplasmic-binding domain-containing protein n=2 Tax=Devosia soli TaxID=361041 RepID=A0A0F5L6Y5_9HYPH|nr:hypothetical protein VW35_12950 [Devosia soli]
MWAFTGATAAAEPKFDADGCAVDFDPQTDYFPTKSDVAFSDNFSVEYSGHFKVVTVARPFPGGAAERYILVQCGTPEPALEPDLAAAPRITIPVRSLFVGSTSENPALVAIGAVDAVTGVAQKDLIATPEILAHVQSDATVQYHGAGVFDVEAVVAAAPDVLMAGGSGEPELQRIAAAGIPVVNFADWQDSSPLGRAEWVKFLGLFFNAEQKANAAFDEVTKQYQTAQALVVDVESADRPLVLSGQPFGGIFFAAGGRSFVAQFIKDAGGTYLFADDTSTGSFQIGDLERLIVAAREADVWIQASMNYRSLADIADDDPRLAELPAAKNGAVWIPDALKGSNGGVEFYELGTMRPDLVLMDLISIFHPEKLPGRQRVFYRSITLDQDSAKAVERHIKNPLYH